MKKIIAMTIIAVIMLFFTVNIGAVTAPILSGDVDYDEDITVLDATYIQRYLTGLYKLDSIRFIVADYDHDGDVTVLDATYIQRYLAQIMNPSSFGGIINTDITIRDFYASYNSEKAVVNTPVVFVADAYASSKHLYYEFYINDSIVKERSEDNTLQYSFANSGEYNIVVRVYNDWGVYSEKSIPSYLVLDEISDTGIYISSFYVTGVGSHELCAAAQASGGVAPYTYRFTILGLDENGITELDNDDIDSFLKYSEICKNSEWHLGIIDGKNCLYTDYSEIGQVQISISMLPKGRYSLQVQAKDMDNNLSAIDSFELLYDLFA